MTVRPHVTINVAATVDGKIDTVERHGAAISSAADRERVDRLRAAVDGVMVGPRTLVTEDPRLIVRTPSIQAERLASGRPPHPAKVGLLLTPDAVPVEARFLTVGPARIILFTPRPFDDADVAPLRAQGVELYAAGSPGGGGRIDLVDALRQLKKGGIDRLLVEGGGGLNAELLRLGLVDEVQVFVAPLIFGGATAPTLADGSGLSRTAAIALSTPMVETFPDGGVLLRYKVEAR